jgi:hypothetical protein
MFHAGTLRTNFAAMCDVLLNSCGKSSRGHRHDQISYHVMFGLRNQE